MGESSVIEHNTVHKSPEQQALDPLLHASAARSPERILAEREGHLHLQLLSYKYKLKRIIEYELGKIDNQ